MYIKVNKDFTIIIKPSLFDHCGYSFTIHNKVDDGEVSTILYIEDIIELIDRLKEFIELEKE